MIRFPLQKPRKLKGVLIGCGSGPAERIKYLQMLVTKLVRDERIEGREDRMEEARGYAEQLINLAIQNGDRHKPTMEMADKWLMEKDLVHKLFKVLAPRFQNYSSTYTSVYRLPAIYPGAGRFQAVLELKGNPYPPVIPKPHKKDNFIVNVLLRSARERRNRQTDPKNLEAGAHDAFIDAGFGNQATSSSVDSVEIVKDMSGDSVIEITEDNADTKSEKSQDSVQTG